MPNVANNYNQRRVWRFKDLRSKLCKGIQQGSSVIHSLKAIFGRGDQNVQRDSIKNNLLQNICRSAENKDRTTGGSDKGHFTGFAIGMVETIFKRVGTKFKLRDWIKRLIMDYIAKDQFASDGRKTSPLCLLL